jgi:heavy metal sensor kinase
VWYTLVLGAPLIAFAVVSYVVFARTMLSRTDSFIRDALTVLSREVAAERHVAPSAMDALRRTISEVRFRDLQIIVMDDAARVVATSARVEGSDAERAGPARVDADRIVLALQGRDVTKPFVVTFAGAPSATRILSRPLIVDGSRFVLTGVYPLDDIAAVLQRIRATFLVAIPLLLLIASTGGYFLAKRSFTPLSEMAARAAEISATNLDERLPTVSSDELGELARVINDLLDRLEGSFAQQLRFMADASHELRTPAAVLRAEADVTLSRSHRAEGEYRESMTIIQDASRRLTRIVDDLFLLARADAGQLVAHADVLYLEELLHNAVRAVRQIADQREVRVELRRVIEAPFHGDADLLGRLVLNLLDNAIKYSPRGSTVDVAMTLDGGNYAISVIDAGPGIPLDAQGRVFERFFRADAARSRSENSVTSGAGLGLAIARRIAEMHGGRLDLLDSRPGHTEFRATLPAPGATPVAAV